MSPATGLFAPVFPFSLWFFAFGTCCSLWPFVFWVVQAARVHSPSLSLYDFHSFLLSFSLSHYLALSFSWNTLVFDFAPISSESLRIGMQSVQSVTATWLNLKPFRLIAGPHYVTRSRAQAHCHRHAPCPPSAHTHRCRCRRSRRPSPTRPTNRSSSLIIRRGVNNSCNKMPRNMNSQKQKAHAEH